VIPPDTDGILPPHSFARQNGWASSSWGCFGRDRGPGPKTRGGAERKGTRQQAAVPRPYPPSCISSSFSAFLITLPVGVLGRSSRTLTSRGVL